MLKDTDLDQILRDASSAGLDDPVDGCEGPASACTAPLSAEKDTKETPTVLCDGAVEITYVKRGDVRSSARIGDDITVVIRTSTGEPVREEVVGGASLEWALDIALRRMWTGEVVDVIGRGEYALADEDTVAAPDLERRWRLELVSQRGVVIDKFRMSVDERITRAHKLRERGNGLLKQGRLRRAADYYSQGSSLMDVIEAEETGVPGGPKNEQAVATNGRIRECQKPLLLNWSLVLIRLGSWQEAERKCTEILLDTDKDCVKALFRRAQCQIQLGELDEARRDLRRAQDLDQSIAGDIAKEYAKLDQRQKQRDAKDRSWAQRAFRNGLGDKRSDAPITSTPVSVATSAGAVLEDENEGIDCRVAESSKTRVQPGGGGVDLPTGEKSLISVLDAQKNAAEADGLDDLTYCRQREQIYNQFMKQSQSSDD